LTGVTDFSYTFKNISIGAKSYGAGYINNLYSEYNNIKNIEN